MIIIGILIVLTYVIPIAFVWICVISKAVDDEVWKKQREKDRQEEDKAQEEYLKNYTKRKQEKREQKERKKCSHWRIH